jgi:hypothetical protein
MFATCLGGVLSADASEERPIPRGAHVAFVACSWHVRENRAMFGERS